MYVVTMKTHKNELVKMKGIPFFRVAA